MGSPDRKGVGMTDTKEVAGRTSVEEEEVAYADSRTSVEELLIDMERSLDMQYESLLRAAGRIERDMVALRESLVIRRAGGAAVFNSNGAIQGAGSDLDRQCGEIGRMEGVVAALKHYAARERGEE